MQGGWEEADKRDLSKDGVFETSLKNEEAAAKGQSGGS